MEWKWTRNFIKSHVKIGIVIYNTNRGKDKIHFEHVLAQEYQTHPKDNRFYFFNPFSIQIFMTVINQILISMESNYREVELILDYYPSTEYTFYLDQQTPFVLYKEFQLSRDYQKGPV